MEAVIKQFRPGRKRIDVTVGESVRIVRELQGLSQNQLAERTGIPRATLSAIENDRVRLGLERAKVLAHALKCHPAVLVHSGWENIAPMRSEIAPQEGGRSARKLIRRNTALFKRLA